MWEILYLTKASVVVDAIRLGCSSVENFKTSIGIKNVRWIDDNEPGRCKKQERYYSKKEINKYYK